MYVYVCVYTYMYTHAHNRTLLYTLHTHDQEARNQRKDGNEGRCQRKKEEIEGRKGGIVGRRKSKESKEGREGGAKQGHQGRVSRKGD